MEQQQSEGGTVLKPDANLPAPAHPEEMNAMVKLTLSEGRSLVATARATPAGLVAVGVLVSAILISAAVLVKAGKQRA
jgi:hypothetical protein